MHVIKVSNNNEIESSQRSKQMKQKQTKKPSWTEGKKRLKETTKMITVIIE